MKEEDIFWKEYPGCSDFIISDSGCDLRISEMEIISFTPFECLDKTIKNCENLTAYARFNIQT
jgi:hypothetical protein